jgi:GntR family transcriptional repressor for pyruvate dehydrogenase complex
MTIAELPETPSGMNQRPGYELAATKIAQFIRASNLQPGARLPSERVLGEQMGISRTVVREAVKMLATAGLVRVRHGSGLYVADRPQLLASAAVDLSMPVDPEHVLDLFEFRVTLEIQTARLAAERITPREVQALEASLAVFRRVAEGDLDPRAADADKRFHQGIATATHNLFFINSVTSVFQLQARAVHMLIASIPGSLRVAADQHAAIYEAIRSGQPDAAAEAMREHVQTSRANYRQEQRRRMWGITP